MEIRAALKEGIARLRRAGAPFLDTLAAELLLMHALGRDRTWLYTHPDSALDPQAEQKYFALSRAPRFRRTHAIHHRKAGILGPGI